MINLTCKTCGSNSFKEEKYKYICQYCNANIIKSVHYSKKKFTIIILLLLFIIIAIFMGYRLLYSVKKDIQKLTHDDSQNNEIKLQSKLEYTDKSEEKEGIQVYHLAYAHPSSNISSPKNKIKLVKTLLRKGTLLERKVIRELGTFVSLPTDYSVNYSYVDRPLNGYDNYDFYRKTLYSGMSQSSMYASSSMSELIMKIKKDIKSGACQRWTANTRGGNLNRDDNFWTNFCPKSGLGAHLQMIATQLRSK